MTQWAAGMGISANRLNSPPVITPLTAGSFANSNAETVIGTFSVTAGQYPLTASQGYEWKVAGTFGGTASPTLTIRIRAVTTAGTIISSGAGTVTSANGFFALEGWAMFTAVGSGGVFTSLANTAGNFNGTAGVPNVQAWYSALNTAWNTTVVNALYVTAQFSAANAANTVATVAGNLYAA